MRVIIENNAKDALRFTGDYIVDRISEFAPSEDKPFTIVLPNPVPSMKPLYDHLVKGYQNGRVSFRHVVFFQLEEFRDTAKDDRRSFASQMYDYFFKYVDAVPQNVYFLNGVAPDFEAECESFENAIKKLGGIRLLCAEVDAEASIGGNTPGSCLTSRTRHKTRTSFILNDRFHTRNGLRDVEEEVEEDELAMGSNYVLTMGLGTIMEAQEVFALFIGAHAARALHHVLEESVSNMFPASILQYHDRVCVMAERRSISTLKYTTVEYFVGLRENYNIVHNLGSQLHDESSPYHHAFKYTLDIPEDLMLNESATPTEHSGMLTPTFGLDRLRSHTPRAESVDESFVCFIHQSSCAFIAQFLFSFFHYWIMNTPSVERDVSNTEKGSGAKDDVVFQKEMASGPVDRTLDDDDLHIPESEMNYLRSKIHEAFDTTLDYAVEASGDGKEKKRKKPGELSEKQQIALLNRARKFVQELDNAYALDLEAFSRGEVADNRLKMMKEIERNMRSTDFARCCLACKVITVFANWIRPGAQGNLPFNRVRTGIYKILYDLPIKNQHIKEGRMGELLVKLWRHPKESEENRIILHQIIEKWLRKVTGLSSDFTEELNEGMEESAAIKADYLAGVDRRRERGFTQEQEDRSVFAMIPKGDVRVYVKDAPSIEVRTAKERVDSTMEKLTRMAISSQKRDR